jgi:hypothetical protein
MRGELYIPKVVPVASLRPRAFFIPSETMSALVHPHVRKSLLICGHLAPPPTYARGEVDFRGAKRGFPCAKFPPYPLRLAPCV